MSTATTAAQARGYLLWGAAECLGVDSGALACAGVSRGWVLGHLIRSWRIPVVSGFASSGGGVA